MLFPNNKEEKELISGLHKIGLPESMIELMIRMIRNGDVEEAYGFAGIMLAYMKVEPTSSENETIH